MPVRVVELREVAQIFALRRDRTLLGSLERAVKSQNVEHRKGTSSYVLLGRGSNILKIASALEGFIDGEGNKTVLLNTYRIRNGRG